MFSTLLALHPDEICQLQGKSLLKNILGKQENTGNSHFLLFPQRLKILTNGQGLKTAIIIENRLLKNTCTVGKRGNCRLPAFSAFL